MTWTGRLGGLTALGVVTMTGAGTSARGRTLSAETSHPYFVRDYCAYASDMR